MTRADVIRMAREAGFDDARSIVGERPVKALGRDTYIAAPVVRRDFRARHVEVLERFAAMVAADANAARIAAQTENEALKAKLAASGVAERRAVHAAVLAEREACAMVADHGADGEDPYCCGPVAAWIATEIRARGAKPIAPNQAMDALEADYRARGAA